MNFRYSHKYFGKFLDVLCNSWKKERYKYFSQWVKDIKVDKRQYLL